MLQNRSFRGQDYEIDELDLPIMIPDDDSGGYYRWYGVLRISDEGIHLENVYNDVMMAEHKRLREEAQRIAHEEYLKTPEGKSRSEEVEEARRKGLLPS